jgi:hypothetical protein
VREHAALALCRTLLDRLREPVEERVALTAAELLENLGSHELVEIDKGLHIEVGDGAILAEAGPQAGFAAADGWVASSMASCIGVGLRGLAPSLVSPLAGLLAPLTSARRRFRWPGAVPGGAGP